MKSKLESVQHYILVAIICFLFNLGGCDSQSKKLLENPMKSTTLRISELFKETRSICFGRFIVEVPISSSVIYGPTSIESQIFSLENKADKIPDLLAERLVEVEREISNFPKYEIADLPLLGKVMDGVVPGQKIVFGVRSSVGYAIDSFTPVGNNIFVQHFGPVPPNEDDVPRINQIASSLRVRSESDIPAESGMCIQGGFSSIEPKYERAAIGLYFEEYPDVRLSIDAHKNQDYLPLGSSPKRLREKAREKGMANGFGDFFSKIKVLREGSRQLGIWEGEEFATRRPRFIDDTDAHEFRFHSMGSIKNAYHPELDIRLDTGVKKNAKAKATPSLTDDEALDLWDRIITTIRLRKPSDATLVRQRLPVVPIGTIDKTGDICPQTGIWECSHKKKIIGEKQKTLIEGEKMPYVLVIDSSKPLQWIFGDSQVNVEATWKLVAYTSVENAPIFSAAVARPDPRSFDLKDDQV